MFFRAALIIVFVLLSLFAWRGWKELPSMARVAAALAVVAGVFLMRSPGALTAATLLTWGVASWIAARKR